VETVIFASLFDDSNAIVLKTDVSAKYGNKSWREQLEVRFNSKLFYYIYILEDIRAVQNPVRYVDELERVQRQRRQQQQNSEVQFVWGIHKFLFYLKNFLILEGPSFLAPNPAVDYLDLDNQPGTSAAAAQQQTAVNLTNI